MAKYSCRFRSNMQAHTYSTLLNLLYLCCLKPVCLYLPSSFSKLIVLRTHLFPVCLDSPPPSYTPLLLPASCPPCSLSPVPFNSNFLLYSMKGAAVFLYSQHSDCITAPPTIGPFKEIYPKELLLLHQRTCLADDLLWYLLLYLNPWVSLGPHVAHSHDLSQHLCL